PARPLTLPLPPQSTPFPYTPLFRSLRYRTRAPAARPARHAPSPGLRPTGRVSTEAGAAGHGPDVTRAGREAAVGTPRFRLRPPPPGGRLPPAPACPPRPRARAAAARSPAGGCR